MSVFDDRPAPSPIVGGRARPVAAEGARCAVATCAECGAALWLDPADEVSPVETHVAWHLRLNGRG
jgi:hypothetical protein